MTWTPGNAQSRNTPQEPHTNQDGILFCILQYYIATRSSDIALLIIYFIYIAYTYSRNHPYNDIGGPLTSYVRSYGYKHLAKSLLLFVAIYTINIYNSPVILYSHPRLSVSV